MPCAFDWKFQEVLTGKFEITMVKYYAVRHRDRKILKSSRSGGFFTVVSDYVLERNGVIYACKLNDDFKAVHARITDKETRDLCRGSKYVQSEIGNTFVEAKRDLNEGRLVLFSGTSCQVNALVRFLGKKYDNLITLDILCHAVPSPKVYEEFKSYFETKFAEKITNVNFRNKEYGWGADVMTINSQNHRLSTQSYYDFFWGHYSIRPSCFRCRYKKIDRGCVDFTIADFWGVKQAAPEYADDRGVSMIICNSALSNKIFAAIKNDIEYKEVTQKEVIQPCLVGNFEQCKQREDFFADLRKLSVDELIVKYASKKRHYRMFKQKVKRILYKIMVK